MAKKIVFLLFIGMFLLPIAYSTPINLTYAKNKVIAYYNDLAPGSDYLKEVDVVVKDAEQYMDWRVPNYADPKCKLAMVLDIDDTSLSNYPAIKKDDFGNLPELIESHYHAANAPAITPVKRLYKKALDKGIAVFFISARKPIPSRPDEDLRPFTIKNLQNVGFVGWSELYIPQGDDLKLSSAEYKTKIRQMLTNKGYDIILNVGDQESDLAGGYADHTEKIPNLLYQHSLSPVRSALLNNTKVNKGSRC